MIFRIYQSLIILIVVVFYDIATLSIRIKGNVSGILGENGTEIECSYTRVNVRKINRVDIMAFNKSSAAYELIAAYLPDDISQLLPQGQYLKGRVTLTSITQSSTKAFMIFNKLMCIDDTFYTCKITYTDSTLLSIMNTSSNMYIQVQVPPSKPDRIALVFNPAYVSVTTTKHDSSTSSEITSQEHETAWQSVTLKNTTSYNYSTLSKTDYDTTPTIPSNDDLSSTNRYRTTYSEQHTTKAKGIVEGDHITVVCAGDVGKPPGEHIFQKYLNRQIAHMQDTVNTTSISEISDNCSFYRTSNLTFQVRAEDNQAVIRCVVVSPLAEENMYVETDPLEVYYPVRMPTIIIYPNMTDYVLGEDTSIHLSCKSDGNPKPSYYWYKENPKRQVSSNENFTITITNITNSGTYTCEINNTFHGDTYTMADNANIKIINAADKSTTPTTGSWLNKAKDNGTVIAIVVLIVIGLVVALIFLLYRRIKEKEEYNPVDRMESNKDQIKSQEKTQTVPSTSSTKKSTGYEDVDLDDTDMKFKLLSDEETIAKVKQHNEEYLKKQKEDEDREKDNPTQPPQATVYACVNKPKNTTTTENKPPADQWEEDVYEESKEGLYDTSGDRRHKENITAENYDSTENLKNEESDHNDLFPEQNRQIGANINKTYGSSEKKEEKRQVATVSPTFRLSSSSQGDGQKHKSDEIQPKTEKQTTHETSL